MDRSDKPPILKHRFDNLTVAFALTDQRRAVFRIAPELTLLRMTAYLTAYPWQSATRQDTLWHECATPPNT